MDALAKAMTPLGWELTADLEFAMGQDSVTLMFSESTDKVLHTPTKEENLKLLQYEEERKNTPGQASLRFESTIPFTMAVWVYPSMEQEHSGIAVPTFWKIVWGR